MVAVIIAYNDQKVAEKAIAALRKDGFEDRQVRILRGDAKKLASELSEYGFDEGDAQAYAKAADGGKTVIVADVSDDKAEQAQSIMERVLSDKGGSADNGADTVSIVEEALSVTKAKTTNGGVRVISRVSETPVEQTVTLTTVTVGAERRATDRVLTDEQADAAFEGKTVEMMGTREVAEVHKEARVVGEVELTKETTERQQTVKDTVRKTDVEIEQIGAGAKR